MPKFPLRNEDLIVLEIGKIIQLLEFDVNSEQRYNFRYIMIISAAITVNTKYNTTG